MKVNMRAHVVLFITLAAIGLPLFAYDNSVQSELNSLYAGKHLALRQPDAADEITFDSEGNRIGSASRGQWYENFEFLCSGVVSEDDATVFTGQRLIFTYDSGKGKLVSIPTERHVRVKLKLSPSMSYQDLRNALLKVFLTGHESMAEVAPDYWETCLRGEIVNGFCRTKQTDPAQLAALPELKVRGQLNEDASQSQPRPANDEDRPRHIKAPQVLQDPEPAYTQIARKAKIQGTVVLWVVIDTDGKPKDIRIVRPLGFGLDDNAVETVKKWTFKPATKNGTPVKVQINIELNFLL